MTPAQTAHIVYVGAPNNYQDLDAALNHVVDRHLANIVTNSYGWSGEALPAGFINPVYNIMVEAAATGVGLYFSSGDDGDETFGDPTATPTPDWPASSPLVTAVGGTSLEWNGTTRTEYGWESAKASLHTDGSALSWGTPAYQYGGGGIQPAVRPAVVPGRGGGLLRRLLRRQQQRTCGAGSTYTDITPAPAGKSVVRVDYANSVDGSDGLLASIRTIGYEGLTIHTGRGYDDVTGLGTPGTNFVAKLVNATPLQP